jgi:hypothetical protein
MSNDTATLVRNLREALGHDLPADCRAGIQRSIELLTGKPEATSAPPDTRPRNALTGEPITIIASKVTVNGKPLHAPKTTEIF